MRLLTRSDFDGLACAALLKDLGVIDSWKFVHPKDLQDGLVDVTNNDVLANVPYVHGAKLWFDHHSSEAERLGSEIVFEGDSRLADSAADVIYHYYGGDGMMPHFRPMVDAVNKVDSAKLKSEEILSPAGWVLLGFIMDPRTGLGRFRNFRISNYELMENLIDACCTQDIDEILANPDVRERVDLYFEQDALFRKMLAAHTRVVGNAIVTDLRGVDTIYSGNRFLVYSLYPKQNISLWIVDGRNKQNCPIAVGHSVLNRTSNTNVGALMLKYGGGGHPQVGTCQVAYDDADRVIEELLAKINSDG
ncbi:MAG: exopolyphosphatase [Clostridiales Family XIII bacterium]|jgi:nanoRNase/pAp phosphatase (c-di-AMP/oligoRNAs hydrolase)|nr:exopolyphosphatase [Clostridiales Family XIII bacterium]